MSGGAGVPKNYTKRKKRKTLPPAAAPPLLPNLMFIPPFPFSFPLEEELVAEEAEPVLPSGRFGRRRAGDSDIQSEISLIVKEKRMEKYCFLKKKRGGGGEFR